MLNIFFIWHNPRITVINFIIFINCLLIHFFRIHTLEEQLRDVEVKSQERLRDEQRKHRDYMVSKRVVYA